LAGVALDAGVPYAGADFLIEPPPREAPPPGVPTVSVIGTGKRTGKTAIAGHVARHAVTRGLVPVVVAMGRGGPPEPQVAEAGSISVDSLVELARSGGHAASDYLEDALTTGVTTIGARRAGGGLAGTPFASNVSEALRLAAARAPDLVVLEGSGSAIPPVDWDAGILVMPATCPPEYVSGYLGPYRILRADLAIVTMATSPDAGAENLPTLISHLRRALGDARFVVTEFHPVPLADVRDKAVFFATTASGTGAARQIEELAARYGCEVVGWSARLADRAGLVEDLDAAQGYDVFLSELKAAAVDTGVAHARDRGAEVVFVDNRAEVVGGDEDLETAIGDVVRIALERGKDR
jgi:cyclic 2,3-diphosphoglycerate synthetase